MFYSVKRNLKYREQYNNIYHRKWFLKILLKSHPLYYNLFSYNKLKNTDISICKLRNRCFVSGRSRAVFSKFRLSRMVFKEYGRTGQLNGITKF